MNFKEIESYVRLQMRGLGRNEILKEELQLAINTAKDELGESAGGWPGVAARQTISGVERYILPSELISFNRVEHNGKQLDRKYSDSIDAFDADPVLLNGGFEELGLTSTDLFAAWTESAAGIAIETTATYGSSNFACKMSNSGTGIIYQNVEVVAGAYYTLTFFTRGDASVAGKYKIYDATNAADIVAATATGNATATYAAVTKKFRAPAGCISVGIYFYAPATSGDAYFDSATLDILTGDWQIINTTGH